MNNESFCSNNAFQILKNIQLRLAWVFILRHKTIICVLVIIIVFNKVNLDIVYNKTRSKGVVDRTLRQMNSL